MSLETQHELIACKSNKRSRGKKTHWKRERRELEAKEERRNMGRLRGLSQAWGRRMAKVSRHQPPWGGKVPLLEVPFGKLVDFQLCDKN
jgi:hypothetical protein